MAQHRQCVATSGVARRQSASAVWSVGAQRARRDSVLAVAERVGERRSARVSCTGVERLATNPFYSRVSIVIITLKHFISCLFIIIIVRLEITLNL